MRSARAILADFGLPASWGALVGDAACEPETSGLSGAIVLRLHRRGGTNTYLKIGEGAVAASVTEEARRTAWLRRQQAIQLPRILGHFERPGLSALLTGAVQGRPIDRWRRLPQAALTSLARSFARLHAPPRQPCPFSETVSVRLARAHDAIRRGAVDPGQFADRHAAVLPTALYAQLQHRVPATEKLRVVHGDATLSNILLDSEYRVGLVDCSHCGCGDPHMDLALLWEGLRDQFGKRAAVSFINAYGRRCWDPGRASFFADLYEFFLRLKLALAII